MRTALDAGVLAPFHEAGVLDVPDVHIASALVRLGGAHHELAVALGAALCVRALRAGSVCVDLATDPRTWSDPEAEADVDLDWPAPDAWVEQIAADPLVACGPDAPSDRPLRLVGTLLYLQRYWQDEQVIRAALRQRSAVLGVDSGLLASTLAQLFPDPGPDRQRLAAATAALRPLTIIAGGPGTGKTTTVARILAMLREVAPGSVALAAPTGKAAARLQEAVAASGDAQPAYIGTLHRLLGWRPDARGRFRHDRSNPLPHDVVIVDETSMVSLPMMARLFEAVRPDARLVLVGDPDQLAAIDAGAVLGDLVLSPPQRPCPELTRALVEACPQESTDSARAADTGVVVLDHNYRFGAAIADLAEAIRRGDADGAVEVLRAGHPDVEFLGPGAVEAVRPDVAEQARRTADAARVGDARAALAALESHRVLCAHRQGRYGVSHWNALLEEWTAPLTPRTPGDPWYVGRPLLVTANDYTTELYNGDTGVVLATAAGVRAAFSRGRHIVELPVAQLDAVITLRAMTIHRGQGSQFDAVTVVLPPADSRLLTRELLYTAITRARSRIRIIGSEESVRAGVGRQVLRASGLRG